MIVNFITNKLTVPPKIVYYILFHEINADLPHRTYFEYK